jgi:hypothetical protein
VLSRAPSGPGRACLVIVRAVSTGELCCLCAHEATISCAGGWFCPAHTSDAVRYIARRVERLRAVLDLSEPEPDVEHVEHVDSGGTSSTRNVRTQRERRPRVDRSALKHMSDRELRDVVSAALERGWVVHTIGKHVQLRHPTTGAFAHTSTSRGSRGRGVANLRAQLARDVTRCPQSRETAVHVAPFVEAQWSQRHALDAEACRWIETHADEGDVHPIVSALEQLRRETVAALRPDGNPLRH